jgi:hypothetical protein
VFFTIITAIIALMRANEHMIFIYFSHNFSA